MPRVRFSGTNHYHDGEPLDGGEVIELTEEQYQKWSYQFERLDDGPESDDADADGSEDELDDGGDDATAVDDNDGGESDAESEDDAIPDPEDLPTVSDLRDALAAGTYDGRLDELEIAERSRENPRDTALEAIEAQKEQV